MERLNDHTIIGYHTQASTNKKLSQAERCTMPNAWLGAGYYFWLTPEFAHYWGEDFKTRKTGNYDIYTADIDTERCLNTTFNEEDYFFWIECIEEAVIFFDKMGKKVDIQMLNRYLKDKFWDKMGVTGIIYDDLPFNPFHKPNRKYSVIEYEENKKNKFFYYRKRIQIVVFHTENIKNFKLHLTN